MLLNFDIEKTIAAVAYLVQREGGELDVFLAIKALYVADKDALIQWGKTITGDSFVSMDKGPVLSTTYNLFKGEGPESEQAVWNANISGRVNHKVHLLHDVPSTPSQSERSRLLRAHDCKFRACHLGVSRDGSMITAPNGKTLAAVQCLLIQVSFFGKQG